jgi:hypothetical protein
VADFIDLRSPKLMQEERWQLCYAFYEQIYRKAFLRDDEMENPETWLPLLEINSSLKLFLHIILAVGPDGQVRGGILAEYYPCSRVALITYMAVASGQKGRNLSRSLLDHAKRCVACDNGNQPPILLVEMENPDLQTNIQDQRRAAARIRLAASMGVLRVDIPYIQPALGAGKRKVEDLLLGFVPYREGIPNSLPAANVAEFFKEFYACLGQQDCDELKILLRVLPPEGVRLRVF